MKFRYIFQFIAMLIGPMVTFAGLYVILYVSESLMIDILIVGFYYLERDMWDPWKPAVAKQFLVNAKKYGF